MDEAVHDPGSLAALRDAVLKGREPPPAQIIARLPGYRWCVVAAVCIGAFMGQVDSSIVQVLLPRLEHEFGARLSTVSWVGRPIAQRSREIYTERQVPGGTNAI